MYSNTQILIVFIVAFIVGALLAIVDSYVRRR